MNQHRIICRLWLTLLFSLSAIPVKAQSPYWEQTNCCLNDTIRALTRDSAGNLFAGTFSGRIYRSVDNGDSWMRSDSVLTASSVPGFATTPRGDLFAAAGSGGVFRSTNNGNTWDHVGFGAPGTYIKTLLINSAGAVLAGDAGNGIYRSSDNGSTWAAIDTGLADYLIQCFAMTLNGIIFVGTYYSGGIWMSTDDGDHWTHSGLTGTYPEALGVTSGNHLFATAFQVAPGVYRSTDAGASWSRIDSTLNGKALAINTLDHLFLGTIDQGAFRSIDDGESWTEINTGLTTTRIYSLAFDKNGYLFAGTDRGVFRTTQSTTSVEEISDLLPTSFALEQNYPNPFNPATYIQFSLPHSAFITLKVFNILGIEVASLLSQELPAGRYRTRWNAEGMASGIYFCRLQTGSYSGTKKLLLLR